MDFVPAKNNLRLFVNGIMYKRDLHYSVDEKNKKVTWLAGDKFKLKSKYSYFAIYDYYLKDQN